MATALDVLRRRLIRELDLGWIITNADLDSISATAIVSANMLRNSNTSAGFYKGQKTVIFRPGAASAADYIRYAGILTRTTGTLAHTGADYADQIKGTEVIELWKHGIRPTRELVDSLNRVLEFEFLTSHHMLSLLSRLDGGMESTGDTNWTDVGTPTTSVKTTTQATQGVPFGPRAYRLIGDAANEGTASAEIIAGQGRTASAFAIVLAEVGTASLQLRDATNSADIGTAVTHSERTPMLVCIRNQTLPATCKAVSLRMLSPSAASEIWWNQVGLYLHDNLMPQLPGFITEGFMMPRLFQGVPRTQIATDVYDANSIDFVPLTEGVDYWPMFGHSDAQQYKVRFRDASLFNWPIFVEYKRPGSDETTFAESETATTSIPAHNLLPRWKMDVLTTILLGKIPKRKWEWYYSTAQKELITAKLSRPEQSIGPAKPYYSTRSVY